MSFLSYWFIIYEFSIFNSPLFIRILKQIIYLLMKKDIARFLILEYQKRVVCIFFLLKKKKSISISLNFFL